MFERYTEKARRVIFFARYEASSYGSPYIESEHPLLGLLRENPHFRQLLPPDSPEAIRKQIDGRAPKRKKISTSVDLPLTDECKRILKYAAEEADRLNHKHIGSEHLLLAMMREEKCFAAEMLLERGLKLGQLREKFSAATGSSSELVSRRSVNKSSYIVLHGAYRHIEAIHERARAVRRYKWHWSKGTPKPQDIVVNRESGEISFDLTLAGDTEKFILRPGGWTKNHCLICEWDLFVSEEPAHSTGYTNGRDWLCTECYDKFLHGPDYFETSHPDIT